MELSYLRIYNDKIVQYLVVQNLDWLVFEKNVYYMKHKSYIWIIFSLKSLDLVTRFFKYHEEKTKYPRVEIIFKLQNVSLWNKKLFTTNTEIAFSLW